MEERMLEDEIAKGIRYKKNPDGTLEIVDDGVELAEGEEFFFDTDAMQIVDGENDEDLVDLTPEEAERVRKQKAEARVRRRQRYEELCAQGKAFLETASYHAAELEYEKALDYDDVATAASVGYWQAKTANFTEPDVLISEYVEAGIESLEFDLGYEAVEIIKKEHHGVFARRAEELAAEEKTLATSVEEKQSSRRAILAQRTKKSGIFFLLTALPMLAMLIATAVVGLKNFSTPDSRYITPTIVLACVSVVVFIVFAVATNKFINVRRLYRKNEKLSQTEEGRKLLEIRDYMELYQTMATLPAVEENMEE